MTLHGMGYKFYLIHILISCLVLCVERLSATLLILNLQASYSVPNIHTDALLKLLGGKMLPQPNTLPESYLEAKKLLKEVGMEYQIIHCCEDGCCLYRGALENATTCPICRKDRYRDDTIGKKIPKKVNIIVFPYCIFIYILTPCILKVFKCYINQLVCLHMYS